MPFAGVPPLNLPREPAGWIDEGEAVVANYSYAYLLQKQNQLAHWAVAKR